MLRKHVVCGFAILLLFGVLMPQASRGDDWPLSPYRAQFAQTQGGEPSASDSVASPVISGKKSIGRGVMFSLVLPGTGQLYSGPWWRALPWFAIEVGGWALFASYHSKGQDKTDEFEKYAGWRDTPNNFDYSAYMYAEWKVASDSLRARDRRPTTDNYQQWLNEPFDTYRTNYLPAPFTHDVMTGDRQQFFEMIGKYFGQFGFGWRDTYNNGNGGHVDPTAPVEPDWAHPAAGLRADTANTIAFDGDSPMFYHYADMRGKANDLLNNANRAMEVVMVNHILSAIDAAIAVRNYNKKITATPKLGDLHLQYNAVSVRGNVTRYLTLTLPLDESN
jgi:hypothetical protein